ncbi:hypothetical protein HaLaN_28287 [Haematococcus lacustris]|uniref:Uncharacterized protein n=1 Tax=Haematococcus lacustris TaxID=44745 RepID=A0A6A0AA13_HAELA|nr:hypothetical protein HaLaN_28287 [Haematococcus lacustris]
MGGGQRDTVLRILGPPFCCVVARARRPLSRPLIREGRAFVESSEQVSRTHLEQGLAKLCAQFLAEAHTYSVQEELAGVVLDCWPFVPARDQAVLAQAARHLRLADLQPGLQHSLDLAAPH